MFTIAKPIYLKNLNKEKNVTSFYAANFDCDGENAILTIAGHSAYRVTVNGDFACFGPSKAISGYAKFDTVDISKYVSFGLNQIVIECATYQENDTNNFIQAEIFADGKVVAATGYNFIGFLDVERLKSKGLCEKYNISGSSMIQTQIEVISSAPVLIKRDVPYPVYNTIKCKAKTPVNIKDTFEIILENPVCGFVNIHYNAHKPTEFTVLNENNECIMEMKSVDGEFQRETFNPHILSKIKICVSKGDFDLKNIFIKEYTYYNGKTPKNKSNLNDADFYKEFRAFIADYNDYNFSTINYNKDMLEFQKKEKLYTDSNKMTEAYLNIPTYSQNHDLKNTDYKELLINVINDNPDIKQIKYKRILNSL